MYHYYNGFCSPFGGLGHIFSVVIWILVIILILKLIKRGKHGHWQHMWENRSALGLLGERFAKGEITKEEYEERRKVLEQK